MLKNKKREEGNHGIREQKQHTVICVDTADGYPAGWYVDNKEDIVSAIATDPEAIREIKPYLVKAGYPFEEREAFWKNTYQNIFSDKN